MSFFIWDEFFLSANKCVLFFFLQAKLETKALKAKRPGFTDERYNETSYYIENGELYIFFHYFVLLRTYFCHVGFFPSVLVSSN